MRSLCKVLVRISLAVLASAPVIKPPQARTPQDSNRGLSPVSQQVVSQPTVAVLEIVISDPPAKGPDGSFTFRVVADDRFPETNKSTGHPHVEFFPYISFVEIGHAATSVPERTEWTYTAKLDGEDKNLVRIRASICEASNCTGKLDKTKERVIDVGGTKFDEYTVMVHPRQLVAGTTERNAYIDLEKQGHVVTPTSTIKLHVSARDGCVLFEPKLNTTNIQDGSIDLVIDAGHKRSQTEYFTIRPATLPPENCVVDVAVYDDEKQRATPAPDQLAMKTNTMTSAAMSFLGCIFAFVFLLWRRIRRSQRPLLTWSDLFEVVAKGCLAILLGLVLTKTDLIGITIDKSSANGFFTTGFLLGFLPLDTIFDRILRGLGVNPPSGDLPQDAQTATS
jgi:hypothetical protein